MKPSTDADMSEKSFSGVPKMKRTIVSCLIFLTTVYGTLVYMLRDSSSFLVPADEFCQNQSREHCSRPDLFAFQIASGCAILFCGLTGFRAWHVTRRAHTVLPNTPEGRLFGYLPESEQLAAANFTFQLWDFFISLLIPEHSTAIMLCHHIMAATVSWCSLDNQYLHYYGVFYLGLSEMSSIFLLFVDLGNYFPPTPGTIYDFWVNGICGPLFAVCFAWYRVILWWKVSYQLWSDAIYVIRAGIAERQRPNRSFVLYIFLILNLPLGILQLYWFGIILGEVKKLLLVQPEAEL